MVFMGSRMSIISNRISPTLEHLSHRPACGFTIFSDNLSGLSLIHANETGVNGENREYRCGGSLASGSDEIVRLSVTP